MQRRVPVIGWLLLVLWAVIATVAVVVIDGRNTAIHTAFDERFIRCDDALERRRNLEQYGRPRTMGRQDYANRTGEASADIRRYCDTSN